MAAVSAYAQLIVPAGRFSRVAAWNLITFTAALILGPLAGGALLRIGPASVPYGLAGVFLLAALAFVRRLDPLPLAGAPPQIPMFRRIREGFQFVLGHRLILACMSIDMVAVLFGDAVGIFPLFADKFGAGPLGYGILKASPALGAVLISLYQVRTTRFSPSWPLLKRSVALFGLAMILFALSPSLPPASLFLVLAGAADGLSVIIRQSVYQAHTPDALRGRVSAMSGIFISASNEIGAFESGLTAKWWGAVPSVLAGGGLTLATVWVWHRWFRNLREEPLASGMGAAGAAAGPGAAP
jgi:hypothetical protein